MKNRDRKHEHKPTSLFFPSWKTASGIGHPFAPVYRRRRRVSEGRSTIPKGPEAPKENRAREQERMI